MIKANELRIGNIILDEKGDVVCVTIDTFYWLAECVRNEEDYKPIPLTEEWLVKLGFEKHEFSNYEYCKGLFNLAHSNKLNPTGMFYEAERGTYLKHVHQLQNLYFALTGEELTIKQ